MVRRASSSGYQATSVMPSSACGTGSPCCDSNRKKWQYLWIVLPRNRKYQSMTRIGPCRARSSRPVSSATSRRAASAGGSPTWRWPFGNPQLRYESRIRRNPGAPSGPRRNTTPPAEVSRWAWRCRFTSPPLPKVRNAECEVRNGSSTRQHGRPSLEIDADPSTPHSPFHTPHFLEDAEREVLPRVRLGVGQQLPQLDHREGGLAV